MAEGTEDENIMTKLHIIEKNEILINKMYVGAYLENNNNHIGHEVINLLKTENDENYIYVNDKGHMANKHNNKIDTIILVRNTGLSETLEVLGQAWGLTQLAEIKKSYPKDKKIIYQHQIEEIKKSEIKYGSKYLDEIYNASDDNKNVIYYTFRADEVRRPKNGTRIFITYRTGEEKTELENLLQKDSNNKIIYINDNHDNVQINISKSSLKMYISCEKNQKAFNNLKEVLESEEYWEKENTTKKANNIIISEYSDHNFIDIIDKKNAEVTYSNLFQHIFEADKSLCREFINDVLKEVEPKLTVSENLQIKREEGHIDLLIYDDTNKNVIVVENKIKSGINGKEYDLNGDTIKSQLKDYYYYVNGKNKNGKIDEDLDEKFKQFPNKFFFIFAPDYNKKINGEEIEIKVDNNKEKTYKIINYSKIYEFFNNQTVEYVKKIPYYYEFLYALEKHVADTDNILETEMYRRFKKRIYK